MENFMYYLFCALGVGGALGLLFSRGYVNAVMGMLVSILGMCGLLFLMEALLLSFVMLIVYAGAVMVLFVYVVMLIGDDKDPAGIPLRLFMLGLWILMCVILAFFSLSMDEMKIDGSAASAPLGDEVLYGMSMFTTFLPMFEIAGAILLVAMTGVIVIAKDPSPKRTKRSML